VGRFLTFFETWRNRIRKFWSAKGNTGDAEQDIFFAIRMSVLRDLIIWFGETIIACIPILAYGIVRIYSVHENYEAWCNRQAMSCRLAPDFPASEFEIISVVTSGLGILSLLDFDFIRITILKSDGYTYLAGLIQLVLLILGTILYTVQISGNARRDDFLPVFVFTLSLLISFYLTAVNAWQKGLRERPQATHTGS
jgi:hypothetical protein